MDKAFKVFIKKNYLEQITLQKLLQDFSQNLISDKDLELQINLEPEVVLNLLDDLDDLEIFKSKITFILNENSKLDYISKPRKSTDKELKFEFIGSGSDAKIKILCLGKKDQIFNFKTVQDHKIENTKSDLIIKGVFDENSKLQSDNLIRVASNAQNVQANQINKNILIGDQSRIVTIPKLEIKADKVKCHHGAAVSKLNKNQLFYLQSRGMDSKVSKDLLIDSFLN